MAAISRRLLKDAPTPSLTSESWATEPPPMSVDSDVVVILAALLCAVICFVGLALVARCAWIRRRSSSSSPSHLPAPQAAAPNKGLKRKELLSLPRLPFRGSDEKKLSTECAICLAEFADGDEIRVLPPCGHGFHVVCVDTWLKSHSSCPGAELRGGQQGPLPPLNFEVFSLYKWRRHHSKVTYSPAMLEDKNSLAFFTCAAKGSFHFNLTLINSPALGPSET